MEQTNVAHRAIALGFFDGIHRGHGQLMERAILLAGETLLSALRFLPSTGIPATYTPTPPYN